MKYSTAINDYDSTELLFDIDSEVYETSTRNEDGNLMEGTIIFLTATTPDGMVFTRMVGNVEWQWALADEEFEDHILIPTADRFALQEKAAWMSTKLNLTDKPRLNPEAWVFMRCVYGSEAYQALNVEEDMLAEEKRRG